MRTAIRHTELPEPRAAASFGRIARAVAAPWHGVPAASANDADIHLPLRAVDIDAQRLIAAARRERDLVIGDRILALLQAARDRLRAVRAGLQRRAEVRATYRALAELDARSLRDLGLTRSELMAVALDRAARPASVRPGDR